MRVPIYQIDAFTGTVFGGNPATICPLYSWLTDPTMQSIAAENNLAETAFFVPDDTGEADFHLRWFTPAVEVDLCGHATLASAALIFDDLMPDRPEIRFRTRSGILRVRRDGDYYVMNFPIIRRQNGMPRQGCSRLLVRNLWHFTMRRRSRSRTA